MKKLLIQVFVLCIIPVLAFALGTTGGSGNGTSAGVNVGSEVVTGGSIDNTPIGNTTTSTGKFTTLNATTFSSSGAAPTCGTGCASITTNSTNTRGSMVSGSSVSAVTLNWSATLAATPFCTISDSNSTAVADISALSTSVLTVSLASALTSVTIYWICFQ